jgi:hypothetical protein
MSVVTIQAGAGVAGALLEVPPRLHLRLERRPSELDPLKVLSQVCAELHKLQSDHRDQKDSLSLKLHQCLNAIANLEERALALPPEDEVSLSELINAAKVLIKKAREEILVDSLYGIPLKKPIRDGDWVWEEEILQLCRSAYESLGYVPKSPLTDASLKVVEEHAFASAMLKFLSALPQEFLLPTLHEQVALVVPKHLYVPQVPLSSAEEVASLGPLPTEARVRLVEIFETKRQEYFKLLFHQIDDRADIVKAVGILDGFVQRIEQLNEVLRAVDEEAQRRMAQKLEARRVRAAAHTQAVVNSIQAQRQAHQDRESLLIAQGEELSREHARVEANLKARIEQQAETITQVYARVGHLEGQVHHLNNQVDDGGSCSIM